MNIVRCTLVCMHVSCDAGVTHYISLLIQFCTRYYLQTPLYILYKVNVLLQVEV